MNKNKLETWKFGIQVFFSTVVIGLCVFKLAEPQSEKNPNAAMYWGGMSGVLAYWLPSPAIKGTESEDKAIKEEESQA